MVGSHPRNVLVDLFWLVAEVERSQSGTQQTHADTPPPTHEEREVMSVLSARVDHKAAKYIMYACMAAPAVAFGLRMVKSAME